MPARTDSRDRYPATLQHSTTQPAIVYERSAERFAWFRAAASGAGTREDVPPPQASGPRVRSVSPEMSLSADDGTRIDVYRGAPEQVPSDAGESGAVYVEPASGRIVVPTGRVLVRFRETIRADARRDALQTAGYRIEAVLSYAPNCAWVVAASGDRAQALHNIGRLEALADVENVEPQWLSPRAMR